MFDVILKDKKSCHCEAILLQIISIFRWGGQPSRQGYSTFKHYSEVEE